MVCPLGSARMEALARLLVARNIQQTASEELGHQKLAAQFIQREFREADEANLIDEEDMHVFGLRPLTDPLDLVCCNACKKPIKASRYVAHAEFCKSLNIAEESILEVKGGTTHKKRPRKEKKKLLTAYSNKPILVRQHKKLELLDNGVIASPCCSEEPVSCPEAKGYSSNLSVATVRNSFIVSPGLVDCSEGASLHQKKHSKMPDFGVSKSWSANSRDAIPSSGERSTAGSHNTASPAIPTHVQRSRAEDLPRPLATKMYYSQSQFQLRSALSYLYHEASCNGIGSELACPRVLKSNVMPADILYSNNSHLQIDYQHEKAHDHSLTLTQKPNLYQMNGTPEFPVSNVQTHTSIGMTGSNHDLNFCSFAGHSGNPIQHMQQSEGNLAVVQNS